MRKLLVAVAFAMLCHISVKSQLVTYSFAGTGTCPTQGNSGITFTNGYASTLSRVGALTCQTAANAFNTSSWSQSTSIDNAQYLEFVVSANAGYKLDLNSLSFTVRKSNTGPSSIQMVHNGTGTFNTYSSVFSTTTSDSTYSFSFSTFSSSPGASVSFRLYGWGATGTSGTLAVTNITLNGSVSSSSPFVYDYVNQRVGLGYATLDSKFQVGESSITTPYNAIFTRQLPTTLNNNMNYTNLATTSYLNSNFSSTPNSGLVGHFNYYQGNISGANTNLYNKVIYNQYKATNGSGSLSYLTVNDNMFEYANSASTNHNNISIVNAGTAIYGGTGNITNLAYLRATPSVSLGGSNYTGTITNQYGLYIGNIAGATNNYSIYSAGGKSYFADSIGIGIAIPGQKVDILGKLRLTGAVGSELEFYDNNTGSNGPAVLSKIVGGNMVNHGTGFLGFNTTLNSNTSEKLRIDCYGNVGIGTTNPNTKFHIYQTTNSDLAKFETYYSGGRNMLKISAGGALVHTYDSSLRYMLTSNGTIDKGLPTGYDNGLLALSNTSYISGGGSGIGRLEFFTNNTSRLRITENGQIGIGTTNPQGILHISGTGQQVSNYLLPIIENTGGYGSGLLFRNNYGSSTTSEIVYDFFGTKYTDSVQGMNYVSGRPNMGNHYFRRSDNYIQLAISDAGNLGIGIAKPTARLHVNGNIKFESFKNTPSKDSLLTTDSLGNLQFVKMPILPQIDSSKWAYLGADIYNKNVGNIGIGTNKPTHTLSLGSATTGLVIYNTNDQIINYERVRSYWSNNTFKMLLEKNGYGANRDFTIGNATNTLTFSSTGGFSTFSGGLALANAGLYNVSTINSIANGVGLLSFTANSGFSFRTNTSSSLSSGALVFNDIVPQIAHSGNAAYTALRISPYEQSFGAGNNLLFDVGINSASNGSGTHNSLFVINRTGNVGIGTNNPLYKLDIAASNSAVRFSGLGAANGTVSFEGAGSIGSTIWFNNRKAGISNFGGANEKMQFDVINGGSFNYGINNQIVAVFNSVGMGIGTTNPTARLHINGSIRFESFKNTASKDSILTTDSLGNLQFVKMPTAQQTDSSKWAFLGNNIYNKNSGNVGIGTNNPTTKLQVNGSVRFDAFRNNSVSDSVLTTDSLGNLRLTRIVTNTVTDSSKWGYSGNNIYNKNLGYVGIGVLSPTAKFHTTGSIRFESYGNNNTEDSVLVTDINGNLKLKSLSAFSNINLNASFAATNGLAKFGNTVALGDSLRRTTEINLNGYDFSFGGNGNIGFGTPNPTAQLHLTKGLRLEQFRNTFSQDSVLTTDINGNVVFRYIPLVANNNSTGTYQFINGLTNYNDSVFLGGKLNDNVSFNLDSIYEFSINSGRNKVLSANHNGNIGIGTIAPNFKVDILGNLNLGIDNSNSSGYSSKLYFGANAATDALWLAKFTSANSEAHLRANLGSVASNNKFSIGNASGSSWKSVFEVNANGNISIGTTQSTSLFSVDSTHGVKLSIGNLNWSKTAILTTTSLDGVDYTDITVPGVSSNNARLRLSSTGSIGIGVDVIDTAYSLMVKGKIKSKGLKVQTTGWADYVFNKNYKLNSLEYLEAYVNKNKHLPEIPTANEVIKDGVDLGDMQVKLLKKVEELTLYIIEQNKRINELEKNNKALKQQNTNVDALSQQIADLKALILSKNK